MQKDTSSSRVFIVALVLGIALAISSISVIAANNPLGMGETPVYPQNESGLTYGSAALAETPEQEPELIAAVGVDGQEGFVYAKDLHEDDAKTPEEAVAQQKKLDETASKAKLNVPIVARTIPLYDIDGKTVIGEFAIVNVPNPNRYNEK